MPQPRSRWLVLAAMAGSASMIMLDQTAVAVALPAVARETHLAPAAVPWVVNATVLAAASLVAFGGRLGDRIGGVTTFRVGVMTFSLAAAACALSPARGAAWLLAARALEGVGAALMMPVSASIVVNAFPARERGRAMALYAGIAEIFLVAGPLISGALTQVVSWRAVFWLQVPLGVLVLALVRRAAPQNTRDTTTRLSLGPVLLLVGGVGILVLSLQQAGRWGVGSLVGLTGGCLLGAWFVRSQRRAEHPLVDVGLLVRATVLGNVLVLGMFQFALLAVMFFGSLYLQDVLGFGPLAAGVGALPLILPLVVGVQLGGIWYDRHGVRPPVLAGLAASAIGLGAWAVGLARLGYAPMLPGMVIAGLGLGLAASPCYTDALGRVAPVRRGQTSGLIQTVRQLGGVFGIAVIGAVVLGVAHDGTRSADRARAALAVAIGYGVAAVVFALALVVGFALLPRSRVGGDDDPRPAESQQVGATG